MLFNQLNIDISRQTDKIHQSSIQFVRRGWSSVSHIYRLNLIWICGSLHFMECEWTINIWFVLLSQSVHFASLRFLYIARTMRTHIHTDMTNIQYIYSYIQHPDIFIHTYNGHVVNVTVKDTHIATCWCCSFCIQRLSSSVKVFSKRFLLLLRQSTDRKSALSPRPLWLI